MTTKYNRKVNIDGSYRRCNGHTVVSELNDNLSSIEQFILKSDVLNKYFSPLPADSYHMTVFNVWSDGRVLPPAYAKIIKDREESIARSKLATEAETKKHDRCAKYDKEYYNKHPGYKRSPDVPEGMMDEKRSDISILRLPEFFWYPIMADIDDICKSDIQSNIKVRVKVRNNCDGVGLGVILELDEQTSVLLTNMRTKISKVVGHSDSNLVPHMTLAYRYRDIPTEELEIVNNEIRKLNEHISSITSNGVTFKPSRACWFGDMTRFLKSEDIFF